MRDIRKAKEYTDMYVTLPDESKTRENINLLLVSLTEKMVNWYNRELNWVNIIALGGGVVSYFSALFAMRTNMPLSIFLWILFGVVIFFTIALSITGWVSRYDKRKETQN